MNIQNKIGITERGDAGIDFSWEKCDCPKILITKAPQNLLNKEQIEFFIFTEFI